MFFPDVYAVNCPAFGTIVLCIQSIVKIINGHSYGCENVQFKGKGMCACGKELDGCLRRCPGPRTSRGHLIRARLARTREGSGRHVTLAHGDRPAFQTKIAKKKKKKKILTHARLGTDSGRVTQAMSVTPRRWKMYVNHRDATSGKG